MNDVREGATPRWDFALTLMRLLLVDPLGRIGSIKPAGQEHLCCHGDAVGAGDNADVVTLGDPKIGNDVLPEITGPVVRKKSADNARYSMEVIMNSLLVSIDPQILGGTPVFSGTRVPVAVLFENLADGLSLEEILDSYPTLTREQAIEALRQAEHFLELPKAA